MRVKYLTTLATISMLSLGVVVGCENPCGAAPKTEQANPCASKNPCAGTKDKPNPCASKNPCAGKEKK
ncbi:MAG: hypothetical protein QNJ63_22720 [Calothrix sp. MO_192.B10]|nr:hypothetical protein [Calothrix sp. MO_192.B10]